MVRVINALILCADLPSVKILKGVSIILDCIKSLNSSNLINVKNWDKINFYYTGDKLDPNLNDFLFDDSITIDGKQITVTYSILPEHFLDLRQINTGNLIKHVSNKFNYILNENCTRASWESRSVRPNDLYKIINELLLLDGYYIDKYRAIEIFSASGFDTTYKNQIELVKKDVNIDRLESDNKWSIFKLRNQSEEDFESDIQKAIELSKQNAGKTNRNKKTNR